MSGYQRFISYLYEYRKGKKDENCGFVKVEERSGRCLIDVRIRSRNLAAEQQAKLYGFVRKQGELRGVLLGSLLTEENKIAGSMEMEAENLHGSGISLSALGGMVLVLEGGGFYGTEWDDFPIHPENFVEMRSEARMVSKEKQEEILDSCTKNTDEKNIKEDDQKNALAGNNFIPNASKEEQQSKNDFIPDAFKEEQQEEKLISQEENEVEEREKTMLQEAAEAGSSVQSQSLSDTDELPSDSKAEELQKIPEFDPFGDGEIQECRKISVQYLSHCNRKDWALRNNRFLLYGFYHFGHLLLGKIPEEQYILGVPGVYDQQERFMANMFGFPHFKASSQIALPQGKGGYWYRLIYPPNFNEMNTSLQERPEDL